MGMHRQKADEAYVIGKRGQYTPVGAYLAADEIVKIAVEHDVNMIHPGYGFLSENAEFARKVEKAGIIVSSPSFSHSSCLLVFARGSVTCEFQLVQCAGLLCELEIRALTEKYLKQSHVDWKDGGTFFI